MEQVYFFKVAGYQNIVWLPQAVFNCATFGELCSTCVLDSLVSMAAYRKVNACSNKLNFLPSPVSGHKSCIGLMAICCNLVEQ